jgi:hypothetical protein
VGGLQVARELSAEPVGQPGDALDLVLRDVFPPVGDLQNPLR